MFERPIDDWSHALLNCVILSINSFDAAISLQLLNETVYSPVSVTVPNFTCVRGECSRRASAFELSPFPFMIGQRISTKPSRPIVDHSILIIDRYSKVAADHGSEVLSALNPETNLEREDNVEWQNHMVHATPLLTARQ